MSGFFSVTGFSYIFTLFLLSLTGERFIPIICVLSALGLLCFGIPDIFSRKKGRKPANTALILAFIMAVAACASFGLKTELDYKPAISLAGEEKTIEGIVIKTLPDSQSGAHRCIVKVKNSDDGSCDGLKIRFSSKDYAPKINDCVKIRARLYEVGSDNENQKEYYKSLGVYLGATSSNKVSVSDLASEDKKLGYWYVEYRTLISSAVGVRERITGTLNSYLPADIASVLTGMLVGDKSLIDDEDKENMTRAGILHLLAVSGFHVSLWSDLLYRFLLRTGRSRRASSFVPLVFIVCFIAITGFAVSAIRAGIMLSLFYIGRLIRKDPHSLNSLGFGTLLISLPNPFSGGDTGFLLSVLATMGIIVLNPLSKKLVSGLTSSIDDFEKRNRANDRLMTFPVSIGALVFTLPIMSLKFGFVSLAGPVSTLLLGSACSAAILMAGIGCAISGIPVMGLLTPWTFLFSGLVVKVTLFVCRIISSLPFVYVNVQEDYFRLSLAAVLILAAVAVALQKKGEEHTFIKLTSMLCVIIVLSGNLSFILSHRGVEEIGFLPVGNGTCVVVSGNGTSSVIGCGGEYNCAYKTKSYLQQKGISNVDAIVVPRTVDTESAGADELKKDYDGATFMSIPDLGEGRVKLSEDTFFDTSLIDEEPAGLLFVKGVKILLLFAPSADTGKLIQYYGKPDVVYTRQDIPKSLNCSDVSFIIVSGDKKLPEKYESNKNVASTKNGGLSLRIHNNHLTLRRMKS